MPESVQEKLKRVRTPRVHITYDVETDGARVIKGTAVRHGCDRELLRIASDTASSNRWKNGSSSRLIGTISTM